MRRSISAVNDADDQNPHVWYDPTTVTAVADAVTAELSKLAPGAADYFADRRSAFAAEMKPYDSLIAAIKAGCARAKTYAATEGVFDDMAAAVGLQNRTPAGYQTAAQQRDRSVARRPRRVPDAASGQGASTC